MSTPARTPGPVAVLLTLALVVAGIAAAVAAAPVQAPTPATSSWPQWGGPNRDFTSPSTGLANSWPAGGPPVVWSRPLGLGHSAIVAEAGRLYTMYRPGKEISRRGPWQATERVVAIEAAGGKTLWE